MYACFGAWAAADANAGPGTDANTMSDARNASRIVFICSDRLKSRPPNEPPALPLGGHAGGVAGEVRHLHERPSVRYVVRPLSNNALNAFARCLGEGLLPGPQGEECTFALRPRESRKRRPFRRRADAIRHAVEIVKCAKLLHIHTNLSSARHADDRAIAAVRQVEVDFLRRTPVPQERF